MKFLFVALFFLANSVFADCDLDLLKSEVRSKFKDDIEVTSQGIMQGLAKVKNFVITDNLLKIRNENFLVANFELEITWKSGKTDKTKSIFAASVDLASCTLDEFSGQDVLGSSMKSR